MRTEYIGIHESSTTASTTATPTFVWEVTT